MNKTQTVISVGIADLNIVSAPNLIRTMGLGSCVGVVLYDSSKKIAGLSHVLLPDSSLTRQSSFNEYKYADTAVPILVEKLVNAGAGKSRLKAKLAGGAQMFQFSSNSDIIRIGPRNVEAVQNILNKNHIPIISSDVGGNVGRTIEFDPVTSKLKIRKVNKEETFI
ncbi:chemotaxis protein CheD [Virgibacillus profundi]|uniref:Probable chemoreceptor glutamine deamidase CheD n=1 Tax=Virgibacillus profundi TaxID=2024555 RepID=A0A2A2IG05_9BACI|nr:chemotaxis protein CheD [Virgibacillus profundi]PAV30023.1 chemotaxis protein CheD [Virgibacillus profundi]PXY54196.1 chemotaxis protein CheD [Virgibacillus profundi]